jgi:hypothetical protein
VKNKNTFQTICKEILSTASKITSTDCKDLEQEYEQGMSSVQLLVVGGNSKQRYTIVDLDA